MNAFTLWEALTDVDDTQLLEADEKGPVKKPQRQLRYGLIAACLALVLTMTLCAGAMAFHQDTTMRYTVRYRENRVTYLCKARAYLVGRMPQYEPLWVPEGYVLNGTFSDEEREKHMSYVNTHVPTDYISITYTRIVGEYKLDLYTLPQGAELRYLCQGVPVSYCHFSRMRPSFSSTSRWPPITMSAFSCSSVVTSDSTQSFFMRSS